MPLVDQRPETSYVSRQHDILESLRRPEQPARETGPGKPYRIPFNRPFIAGNELESITQSVMSGHVCSDGTFTKLCQQLLMERFGAQQVLLTTSCTAALEMAALLLNIREGDEVILPSYTFVSTANAFLLRGAKLVFVDIRPDTLNIDETLVGMAITARTKAIIPVHYAGIACEMDAITAIARERGVHIIEDAAQGVDARYKGRYLGTIGDFGTYSFHETKNVICGEGGALIVNNPAFAERSEFIRDKGTNRGNFARGKVDKYTWIDIGSSYALADVLAAFLWEQLNTLDVIRESRRIVFELYYEGLRPLQDLGLLQLPAVSAGSEPNYHMFYILLDRRYDRAEVIRQLQSRGIQAVFHFVPLHVSPMGARMGWSAGMLPITEDLSVRLLRLPFYCSLSGSDIDAVVSGLFDALLPQRRTRSSARCAVSSPS
jgi:dTDP-4-amino-4,6-dideoxygalactose transaminase